MYACLPLFSDAVFVNLSSNKRGTWDGERGIKIKKKKKRLRGLLQCPAAAKPVSFLNISKKQNSSLDNKICVTLFPHHIM